MKQNKQNNPVSVVVSLILTVFLLFADMSSSTESNNKNPKHFVLVHGAGLGAWSWYKLLPLLQSSGHNVTAVDLAASGINLLPVSEVKSLSDYAKPLTDLMEGIPATEKVILVGQSLGGVVISLAMELYPEKISVAVFLAAVMPGPHLPFGPIAQKGLASFGSALDNKLNFDNGPNHPPTSLVFGPKFISQVLYPNSPHEDVALACMLVRPVPFSDAQGVVFTEAKYGSVKRVYIKPEIDHTWPEEFLEMMMEKNPPNQVEVIPGSDHMVMISQPAKLSASLLAISHQFAS